MVALLPYGLLDLRVESYCPYLDHDVMDHALSLDPIVKGDRRLQKLALHRHFPALADIPSSHSPVSEIPSWYLEEMASGDSDPDHPGRLTVRELTRLAHGVFRDGPQPDYRDVTFAVLSALGLARLRGRWRESHARNLLQAARALAVFRRPEEGQLTCAQDDALGWLRRWRSVGDPLDPP
jgi:hypothetical protein